MRLTIIFLLALFSATNLFAQEEDEAYQNMLNAIKEGQIEFTANQANPAKAGSVNLISFPNRQMLFTSENAEASLPYFGSAQVSGYGTDSGIEFNGPIENLKLKENEKKKKVDISFMVKSKSDTYRCNFTVFAGGSASLNVLPNNRDRIVFNGNYVIK